ncbi:MAG: hypothetical protein IJX64_01235 [Clostridia bacterium]|nr:hypothetical protein [Clostridia bacterium]
MADFKDILNTPDTTAEFDQNDIQQNKVMAVLAYFGLLFLVPLLAAKESKYAKFHTNQGLVLWIAGLIAGVVSSILAVIPVVGEILGALISLVMFALMIIGIVNAATGKAKELPVIGKIKLLK